MERITTIEKAKEIMGNNFIGPQELSLLSNKMSFDIPDEIPCIRYSSEELMKHKDDYILVLGLSKMSNGEAINIKMLKSLFGINPVISEPCFYNQDWYMNETFADKVLEDNWYLIQKNISKETRGKTPEKNSKNILPSAILCAFVFFVNYYCNNNELLWEKDFVWCSDVDENNDIIYVGRYIDVTGFSKNGFSVHRHLKIRDNYGAISCL